jgi:hypothetical protein
MNKKYKKFVRKGIGVQIKPSSFVSRPMHVDIRTLEEPLHRAEIVIHGIDGSRFSYEGRVFLNNSKADQNTPLSLENGYVGSYYIFGYAGLFQYDIAERNRYDYRQLPSPIIEYKRINATDALRSLGQKATRFTITIVPILPGTRTEFKESTAASERIEVVRFKKIGIITQ